MTIKVYTDGAARPNPGKGGVGVVIRSEHWNYNISDVCSGKVTNNQAEYIAVIKAMQQLIDNELTQEEIIINSDSELLVEQLSGRRSVVAGSYIEQYNIAKQMMKFFKNIKLVWIPREENGEANMLASKAL